MATSDEIRQVAIEVKNNTAALKTLVDALKAAVDAVHAVTDTWVVNSDDVSLPASADVGAQVNAYNAISVSISKPSNNLSDSLSAVLADVV